MRGCVFDVDTGRLQEVTLVRSASKRRSEFDSRNFAEWMSNVA